MANTFSGTNNELYEISDVQQLVGLRSYKNRSIRLSVRKSTIDSAIYTSVVIYNESLTVDIISMLVSCENDVLGVSDAIIGRDEMISVLAAFGFNVSFSNKIELDESTIQFLKTVYAVGYNYFKITEDGVILYLQNMTDPINAKKFTGYDACDFSKFYLSDAPKSVYNIGDYI